jgi:hypothetical protein
VYELADNNEDAARFMSELTSLHEREVGCSYTPGSKC